MVMTGRLLPVLFILLITISCHKTAEENSSKATNVPITSAAEVTTNPSTKDYGDGYIDGSIGDASNLIPYLSADSASSSVQDKIYSSLIDFDKDLNIIPSLAKRWDISEDQRTITFHLRNDVKWHDNYPWTSADLVFQYEVMVNPEVPSAYKETFLLIDGVSAPSKYTFIVTFKEPFAPGLVRVGGMSGLPKHLMGDIKPIDILKSSQARNPVGNGPWKFKEWKSQEHITVEANKNFWNVGPYVRWAMTRIIPDLATQFLELKSGSIDSMSLQPIQYKKQTDTKFIKANFNKYKYTGNAYTYIGYNLKKPLFQDVRVRQALSYAIDKKEIIEGVLLGLGVVATGPIRPGTWAYNSNVKKYNYNPSRALELLSEAGWKDTDADGVLDKQGKSFEFELMTNQGNVSRKKTAEIIQHRLKKLGIIVKIRIIEWSAFINSFINKRKFDAIILGWSLGVDPDQYIIWHSSKTGEHELNFISYNNRHVDEILDHARKTFDNAQRKKLYARFQEIIAKEQPYTFLYVPEALPIVSNRFNGIVPGPAGVSYNFEKWWVRKAQHRRSF
tara:strand:+ start:5332 stop:7008 length:1677 start_codon:yes stop_codon:yes gene_type:complete